MSPTLSRAAGALYLVILLAGVWSEGFARGSLIVAGDAAATAANITAHAGLWRLSFAADAAMVLSDVLLAVALFTLLKPAGALLSGMAAVTRLTQAALLAMNLLTHSAVLLVLTRAEALTGFTRAQVEGIALLLTEAQALNYDIGLIFFGVSCFLVGALLRRAPEVPNALGWALMASGPVYLIGSGLRVFVPALYDAFAPAYVVPLLAESALCLWLLARGGRRWTSAGA